MVNPPKLKPLPIGIQTFADIIRGDFLYIDKTKDVFELAKESKGVFFLSRPRRFGKSLLISTLEALFQNRRELFNGLWIDSSDYQWQEYPVIRIDMSDVSKFNPEVLSSSLIDLTNKIALSQKLPELSGISPGTNLRDLIKAVHSKYSKQVVVLIDEYDKAILDTISDTSIAKVNRDILREFYSVLKSQDQYLRFVFLTGVSKFSKVSIFSGLNNLRDISMESDFATICGYTQEELELNFAEYIQANGFDDYNNPTELKTAIREWYNGYRFSPYSTVKVYNPFSTLLLFQKRTFEGHWFATGTPKFLIDIIDKQNFSGFLNFESLKCVASDLERFDFDNFHLPSILYQTGYLTIRDVERINTVFELELSYPNKEVQIAFSKELLNFLAKLEPEENTQAISKLAKALSQNDLKVFFEVIKSYFAALPYDIHIPLEKYYQSLIFFLCRLISERITAELRTNTGRIDMVVENPNHIYIFEFKLNTNAQAALAQIQEKNYAEAFKSHNKSITLIGVGFSTETRNISDWDFIEI